MGKIKIVACLFLALLAAAFSLKSDGSYENNRGNRNYYRKKFDEAEKSYREGLLYRPYSPELHYNLANLYYSKGDYQSALKEFDKAARNIKDKELSGKIAFNTANTLAKAGDFEGAASLYREYLKKNPSDMDAKYNYELAKKTLEKMKNDEKKDKKGKDKKDKKDRKDNKNKDGDKKGQDKDKGKKGEEKNDEGKAGQAKEGKQKGMPEQEAKMILKALEQDEKEALKERVFEEKKKGEADKDW